MADSSDAAWAEGIALHARVWEFLAQARAGHAERCPDVFEIATSLALMLTDTLAYCYRQVDGLTEPRAEAKVDALIEEHRLMHWQGSTAAPDFPPTDG